MKAQQGDPGGEISFAERLQADLLDGKYRPGEWLKQVDLESNYGVNRFEVRIALSELTARHLLDHSPNRGYRVANPSGREREELYEVRTFLETAAARTAAVRATAADLEVFEAIVREFDREVQLGNLPGLVQLNGRLHDTMYAMCGNNLLNAQIRELRARGIPGRSGTWDTLAGVKASNEDHLSMLEMLKRRDADGLAHIVYRHLNRWREFSKPLPE
ncbi:MAG TPA: GntR family transcriptional regulator [Steroidobacteraceae bacterium]|nr:GntR family transcriptional regulator [Steroidobacteraceae bacterium]